MQPCCKKKIGQDRAVPRKPFVGLGLRGKLFFHYFFKNPRAALRFILYFRVRTRCEQRFEQYNFLPDFSNVFSQSGAAQIRRPGKLTQLRWPGSQVPPVVTTATPTPSGLDSSTHRRTLTPVPQVLM